MYDPILGRFLSPDIYVQAPGFTQSYNRYSYCFNNPLAFTDPSGYLQTELPVGAGGISFDNSWIHKEKQDGGGGAGGKANPDWAWEYIKARHDGFMGSAEVFLKAWDKAATNPSSNGTWVIYTTNYIDYYDPETGCYIATRCIGTTAESFKLIASGQGGGEISFNDNAWYVVPAGMNDLANTASGQAWTKSVNYVRIGSAEAKAQQLLSGVVRTTKYIGWAGNVVDLGINGINAYNHWNSPDAGFYQAKAVGAGLIIGLNGVNLVVPGLGTVLSLTAGAIDAGGGFDWIYDEFR